MWHTRKISDVTSALSTDRITGLSPEVVEQRLVQYGKNSITRQRTDTLVARFVGQFKNPLIFILVLAGIATLLLHEYLDALVVFVAIVVNVGIGLFQESRASQAFEKLVASQEHRATVVRGGTKRVVAANELVPGDVVILAAGDQVPADIYLTEAHELSVNEAPLTGESAAVDKHVGTLRADVAIAEQTNMGWMGTFVDAGNGRGIVVATGKQTQFGTIAESLAETEEVLTPIQRNVKRLARFLSLLILIVVVIIFIIGMLRGEGLETMILLAVAVAVSVIPEGLPAAVTAVLAIGMEKILSRGGLVRNLLAAETLGSTTIILTDKTGTLTEARMHLRTLVTLSGVAEEEVDTDARRLLEVAVYASDGFIEEGDEEAPRGRPIERAIMERALALGIRQEKLFAEDPRRNFIPFNSRNRFAASFNGAGGDSQVVYFSGAPGTLLESATHVLRDGVEVPITDDDRTFFKNELHKHARSGMRFISAGYKSADTDSTPNLSDKEQRQAFLHGLVFCGLLGFEDPLRTDVPSAIKEVTGAGARVIVLTGDNPETAKSIAVAAGIAEPDAPVLRGSAVEEMLDEELLEAMYATKIFARMLPEQKLRMVKLLQGAGEVVAMTGDGVNDAPALQRANIGVAVGSGTEVAQEASDLVLLNNSFTIIVSAIEEGRRIIDNLKKVITLLLSTSFHEVFIIAFAVLFGFPLPVLPVQILWVNILEEGFLSFGFAFEPAEDGLMLRNPKSERVQNILTKEIRNLILIAGVVTGIFSLGLYIFLLMRHMPIGEIRTIMFVVLSLDSLLFTVSLKHLRRPFWYTNILNNHYVLFALGVSIAGIILTLALPPLRQLLSLIPPAPRDLLILVVVGVFNILTIETAKYFAFKKHA